ncbi:type II secretion system protein [Photobacterium damselae]|uniref:type II secretion system protein n=1 Tax=Photobacterium damselae TaxID=38293 RepID=UPI0022AA2DA4|nr:type II secretion system protein [Photobacterium damselae]
MKKVVGFTLIELVVVIVILGILAVTAAPKFLGLQVDARNAALKGLEGTLKSALGVGYSKMAILGVENSLYATNRARGDNEKESLGIFSVNMSIIGCPKNSTPTCVFRYGYPYGPYTFERMVENIHRTQHGNDWVVFYQHNGIVFTSSKNAELYENKQDKTTQLRLKSEQCYLLYKYPVNINDSYTLTLKSCK